MTKICFLKKQIAEETPPKNNLAFSVKSEINHIKRNLPGSKTVRPLLRFGTLPGLCALPGKRPSIGGALSPGQGRLSAVAGRRFAGLPLLPPANHAAGRRAGRHFLSKEGCFQGYGGISARVSIFLSFHAGESMVKCRQDACVRFPACRESKSLRAGRFLGAAGGRRPWYVDPQERPGRGMLGLAMKE